MRVKYKDIMMVVAAKCFDIEVYDTMNDYIFNRSEKVIDKVNVTFKDCSILADEKLFNKYKNYYVRNVVCLDNYKVSIILTKQRDL